MLPCTCSECRHALGITDWYVHACPARANGGLPQIDVPQARTLVAADADGQVLAWVGRFDAEYLREIAARCGFASEQYLCAVFARLEGRPPGAFRAARSGRVK